MQKNFDEVAHERCARSTEAAHYLGVAETVSRRVLNCCENSGGEENQK